MEGRKRIGLFVSYPEMTYVRRVIEEGVPGEKQRPMDLYDVFYADRSDMWHTFSEVS